ncbi:MAG: L,D-transpeptidase [Bacillota bacterium]|nr:L,D-transpeptidase [Bacillota bacterium]
MKKKIVSIVTVMIMAFTVFAITPDKASASGKYWLKINVKANVVNVYKKTNGKWKPFKVMLCSCGKSSTPTPIGTYSIKKKWRWKQFHVVSGQYVSQFNGNYLIHSVVYAKNKKPGTCKRGEYNKLGRVASHGCVRLATMDAKWIYQNCGRGTKVTTYKSKKAGPLGKPKKVSMAGSSKLGWDPTDSIKKNKKFRMTGPTITINKEAEIEYGAAFDLKAGVSAKSKYTFQNLTSYVKVAMVEYRPDAESEYTEVPDKIVDTQQAGMYRITYSCYNKYCGRSAAKLAFELTVKPEPVEEPADPEIPQQPDTPETPDTPGTPDAPVTDPAGE